jgi:ABC-2 type transport system permease protein
MADVTRLPGVFEQIRLVAGARWLILKHGLRKKNNVWDLIGMIWAGVFAGSLTFGLSFAFFFGGYEFLKKDHANWLALLYWAIFIWWQIFPIFVAGFGSNFEFSTLLRFPLSRRAFYLLGLGYGLSDFAALSSICWTLCMIAGATAARPSVFPAITLVSVIFLAINVTVERLIGTWIEKLLAKRRMRELFVAIFVMCMVSLNFIGPMIQRWGATRQRIDFVLPYLRWMPGSLAGNAVGSAMGGYAQGFALCFGGLIAWAAIASFFLWQRFSALYSGELISEGSAPSVAKKRAKKMAGEVAPERPGLLSPQVAAMARKEFCFMTRNGFAFLQLLLPPIMVVFFTMQFGPGSPLAQHSTRGHAVSGAAFFPGIVAYLMLILLSPAYNSFAYESKGVQTYFMAPIRIQDVLVGKNIFLCCLVGFELLVTLPLLVWRLGWPGAPVFVATILAAIFAVVGQLAIANWSSLSFPKKMEIGKMKGQRNSAVSVWIAFGVQIVLMGIGTLIFFGGRWTHNPWLPSGMFAALAAAAFAGYLASLGSLSGLAERKKEGLIEALTR